ncbi:hypothetical protein BDV95DRAFT_567301 [Massariosphaeria phaeospora]|uniref:Uncharacterized protein n=1 Tax=Massariosphaeria phaeospora TaxID=100035 RepID=A0A7C8IDJ1_9PLEO|nr:hypothetical protein BDV95DRAFT_567301 [Massariosphaeria phaeospora]
MPHKHKRKADNDETNFNLPPSVRAAALPAGKAQNHNPGPRNKKRKIAKVSGYGADDTPKAFARLMAFTPSGKKSSGLDDGTRTKSKKPKPKPNPQQQLQTASTTDTVADLEKTDTPNSEAQPSTTPKIRPGERLAEFAQRVNAALPLAGVARSSKKLAGVSDHRVTKHEKKLKRLQRGWRAEEARLRDKEQEALELAEEEQDEEDAMWEDKTAELPDGTAKKGKKTRKMGRRKRVAGEVDGDGEDEWEALRMKREQRKGLHDVVKAPPQFDKVPREIFKVKNGARVNVGNVPNAGGSLRKREELGEERLTIIETYRKLMAAKKAAGATPG